MSKPYVTVRYEESEGSYVLGWYEYDAHIIKSFVLPKVLKEFQARRMAHSYRYPVSDRPEWLSRIVTFGLVGGFAIKSNPPPYELTIWFHLDKQGDLVSFVNFED